LKSLSTFFLASSTAFILASASIAACFFNFFSNAALISADFIANSSSFILNSRVLK